MEVEQPAVPTEWWNQPSGQRIPYAKQPYYVCPSEKRSLLKYTKIFNEFAKGQRGSENADKFRLLKQCPWDEFKVFTEAFTINDAEMLISIVRSANSVLGGANIFENAMTVLSALPLSESHVAQLVPLWSANDLDFLGEYFEDEMSTVFINASLSSIRPLNAWLKYRPMLRKTSRSYVVEAIERIGGSEPGNKEKSTEKQLQARPFCISSLVQVIQSKDEKKSVLEMAMCGLMNLKATQALPMIRQLFVDKRVSSDMCGDYADIAYELGASSEDLQNDDLVQLCLHCNKPKVVCEDIRTKKVIEEVKAAHSNAMTLCKNLSGNYHIILNSLNWGLCERGLTFSKYPVPNSTDVSELLLIRCDVMIKLGFIKELKAEIDFVVKCRFKHSKKVDLYDTLEKKIKCLDIPASSVYNIPVTIESSHYNWNNALSKKQKVVVAHLENELSFEHVESIAFDENRLAFRPICSKTVIVNWNNCEKILLSIKKNQPAGCFVTAMYIHDNLLAMATNSVFTCNVLNNQTGALLATLDHHDFCINIIRINDRYIVVSDKSSIICVYSKKNYLLICKIPVYRLKVSSTDGYFHHFTSLDLFGNTIIVGTRGLPQYYDAETGFYLGNCKGLKEQPPRGLMGREDSDPSFSPSTIWAVTVEEHYFAIITSTVELAIFSKKGDLLYSFAPPKCTNIIHLYKNIVAMGSPKGIITIFDAARGKVVISKKIHNARIEKIHICENKEGIIINSISKDYHFSTLKIPKLSVTAIEPKEEMIVIKEKASCFNCGQKDVKLLTCSKCLKAKYCTQTCQRNDWPRHKLICGKEKT